MKNTACVATKNCPFTRPDFNIRKNILSASALFFLMLCTPMLYADEDIETLRVQGFNLNQNQKYDEAIQVLNQALQIAPDDAGIYNERGNSFLRKRDYGKAIFDYTKSIELNKNSEDAFYPFYNRGLAKLTSLQQFPSALEDFDAAIKINPRSPDPYPRRAFIYALQGNFAKAIEDYTTALKLAPQTEDVQHIYSLRGKSYRNLGKYSEAISDLSTALKVSTKPDKAALYLELGLTYAFNKNGDLALKAFNQALAAYPEYAYAYLGRGYAHRILNQLPDALTDLNRALSKANQSRNFELKNQVLLQRAITYTHMQSWDQAIQDYTEILSFNPEYAHVFHDRSMAFAQKGMTQEASSDRAKAISLNPVFANENTIPKENPLLKYFIDLDQKQFKNQNKN